MAVPHTHARMLKHKAYRVLQAKIETILEIKHDPKYTKMPNATHANCNYSGLGYSRTLYGMLQLSCIQFRFESTMQLVWCAEPGACKTDE